MLFPTMKSESPVQRQGCVRGRKGIRNDDPQLPKGVRVDDTTKCDRLMTSDPNQR